MERFGEKLRVLRKQHNLTMIQLTELLEIPSQGYLSNLETGRRKPSATLVVKIADFFKVPLDNLMRDEKELGD